MIDASLSVISSSPPTDFVFRESCTNGLRITHAVHISKYKVNIMVRQQPIGRLHSMDTDNRK